MQVAQKKDNRRYTYRDYLLWPEKERWEIIDGIAYSMTPAPTIKHQSVSGNLFYEIKLRLKEKNIKCFIFSAPTDVVFDEQNVVQPDILIVCDENKIKENHILGSPDIIIEITSPSTEVKDRREKLRLYEKGGVKEYVIAFPDREYIERYLLIEGRYGLPEIYNWDEVLKFNSFEIEIPLWEVFEKEGKADNGSIGGEGNIPEK